TPHELVLYTGMSRRFEHSLEYAAPGGFDCPPVGPRMRETRIILRVLCRAHGVCIATTTARATLLRGRSVSRNRMWHINCSGLGTAVCATCGMAYWMTGTPDACAQVAGEILVVWPYSLYKLCVWPRTRRIATSRVHLWWSDEYRSQEL